MCYVLARFWLYPSSKVDELSPQQLQRISCIISVIIIVTIMVIVCVVSGKRCKRIFLISMLAV